MNDDAAGATPGRRSIGASGGQQIGLFETRSAPPAAVLRRPQQEALLPSQAKPSGQLRVSVLGSGSRGNSVLIEVGRKRLLVDCGFSCRELERRCSARGVELRSVDAILLTHEHQDHCRGARQIWKRHGIPIFATQGTAGDKALRRVPLQPLLPGERQEIAGFEVESFPVPHDAREPVGLVVESSSGSRIGVLADSGRIPRHALSVLRRLHGLILESNHDPGMLRTGPYPWALKQRVAGGEGHLSNDEAAQAMDQIADDTLQWVVAYHLSEVNNMPVLAERALSSALARTGSSARVELAAQSRPTPWLTATALPLEAHVPI